jgi:hypothetical protein
MTGLATGRATASTSIPVDEERVKAALAALTKEQIYSFMEAVIDHQENGGVLQDVFRRYGFPVGA